MAWISMSLPASSLATPVEAGPFTFTALSIGRLHAANRLDGSRTVRLSCRRIGNLSTIASPPRRSKKKSPGGDGDYDNGNTGREGKLCHAFVNWDRGRNGTCALQPTMSSVIDTRSTT
jgi:hypothetical protein